MDITMCCAKNCTHSNKCYRYRKEPSNNQSYYNYEYECNIGSGFDYFESMLETDVNVINKEGECICGI